MADEKLPDAVEEALKALWNHVFDYADSDAPTEAMLRTARASHVTAVRAIHRFAREREAAALERAAKVCDAKAATMQQNFAASMNDEWLEFKTCYETAAKGIRALIHKEPANG